MDNLDPDDGDDGFGPGSDLVMSFLGVVLLLIGVTVVTGLPKPESPAMNDASRPLPPTRAVPDAQVQALVADRGQLRAIVETLHRESLEFRERAERAEQALKDTASRLKQAKAQEAAKAANRGRPQVSLRCDSLLQRASSGDAMTPSEQTELRKCV